MGHFFLGYSLNTYASLVTALGTSAFLAFRLWRAKLANESNKGKGPRSDDKYLRFIWIVFWAAMPLVPVGLAHIIMAAKFHIVPVAVNTLLFTFMVRLVEGHISR